MKIDCVLTAVNENPFYLDFVPIFIKTWKKLYRDFDIKIILIMDTMPESFFEFKDFIILFSPIPGVESSFISQYIRILYPCILQEYENGVLITDIDLLPMNNTYFRNPLVPVPDDKFVHMRGTVLEHKSQVAICYNVATPTTWKSVIGVSTLDDIIRVFEENFKKTSVSWFRDQEDLYTFLNTWSDKKDKWVKLTDHDCGFKRLNRNGVNLRNYHQRHAITTHQYSDYHCLRPMKQYSKINSRIYYLL